MAEEKRGFFGRLFGKGAEKPLEPVPPAPVAESLPELLRRRNCLLRKALPAPKIGLRRQSLLRYRRKSL